MVIGLKVEPSSNTLCVVMLRSSSVPAMPTRLGLKVGIETMATTSPVFTSSTMPPPARAWKVFIARPSSLSIAAWTRVSIESATGWPAWAGFSRRSSSTRSMPLMPWPSVDRKPSACAASVDCG